MNFLIEQELLNVNSNDKIRQIYYKQVTMTSNKFHYTSDILE